MRAYIQLLLLLVWAAGAGAEARPSGPLPLRNFQPVQQLFLNLPFERARVLARGESLVALDTAHSNVIATDSGRVDALLKFEQNRVALTAGLGLAHRTQCLFELPFGSRFGGFLDPLIDSTEEAFGAFNPERKLFPNNSFGGFRVRRGDLTLFQGPRQVWEVMDTHLRCQWQAWDGPHGVALALRGAVKFPTGRTAAVWGSGNPDLGLGAAVELPLGEKLWVYSNISGVQPLDRITAARLTLDPIFQQAVGFEWVLLRGLSAHLQQELYTSPFHGLGTRVLEGTVVELALGLSWQSASFGVQLGAIDNVSGVAQAADFTAVLRVWKRSNTF